MNPRTINIHGKEYETVSSRIEKFRNQHPLWAMETKIINLDGRTIVLEATISDETGRLIANGHAEETRNSSHINKTSALENAETSAWGRALANLGLGGDSIASADEVKNAIKGQNTQPEAVPTQNVAKINAHQNKLLQDELKTRELDIDKFYAYYKVKFLHELPSSSFKQVYSALQSKPLKAKHEIKPGEKQKLSDDAKVIEAKKKLEKFMEKHDKKTTERIAEEFKNEDK